MQIATAVELRKVRTHEWLMILAGIVSVPFGILILLPLEILRHLDDWNALKARLRRNELRPRLRSREFGQSHMLPGERMD